MDIEVLLGLLAIGLVIGVPTAAFVALARTGRLSRDIVALRATVGQLRGELAELRRQAPAAVRAEPQESAPTIAADAEAAEPVDEPVASPLEAAEPVAPREEPLVVEPRRSGEVTDEAALRLPSTAPARTAGRPALEERIGARVFVWVGGVALALAGAFLVKYS